MTDQTVPAYARLFMQGLHESEVSLVAALPESLLKSVYQQCELDEDIRYVLVSNEADLPGIVAAGIGLGPFALGVAYEMNGSYTSALFWYAALCVAITLTFLLFGPYKYQQKG